MDHGSWIIAQSFSLDQHWRILRFITMLLLLPEGAKTGRWIFFIEDYRGVHGSWIIDYNRVFMILPVRGEVSKDIILTIARLTIHEIQVHKSALHSLRFFYQLTTINYQLLRHVIKRQHRR